MYLSVQKYADKGSLIGRLVPAIRGSLAPLLKQAPGFKGYRAFASGDGHIVSANIFDGRQFATRPTTEVLPQVREHALPVIAGAPGFRGYYIFRDERDVSRGVSVSIHQTREHAMEANQQVVSVMRERRIASNPPSVIVGPTVVAATNAEA